MEDKFILGAIESPVDLRDYDYSTLADAAEVEIPESFELDYCIPVQNQGKVNSCVAFSLSEIFFDLIFFISIFFNLKISLFIYSSFV